jgi:hypothetical protein
VAACQKIHALPDEETLNLAFASKSPPGPVLLPSTTLITGRMNVTLHDSIASDDMFVKFSGSWIGGGSTAGAPRLGGGVSGVFGGGGTIEQSGLGGYLLGRRRELDGHASSGPR